MLKAYSDKRNEPKQDHKPLIVEPKITKKNHSNNDATLTQLFQPWRNISTINKFEGEPVDVNVWNKLPLSACNDLLVDDKRTTEKIIVQHEMVNKSNALNFFVESLIYIERFQEKIKYQNQALSYQICLHFKG